MLLYTISATGQVAINISVFVRLMLLRPKAASTEFARRGKKQDGGTGERTRKPEPGNRKKGAKGRGPKMPGPGNRKTEISVGVPEFLEFLTRKF